MGHARNRPKLLPDKLLMIREFLNLSQVEMASSLQSEILSHSGHQYEIKPSRISEYENGKREPNLFVLIAYVRLGKVQMESVLDDDVSVVAFRKRLGKQLRYVRLWQRTKKRKKPVPLISGT